MSRRESHSTNQRYLNLKGSQIKVNILRKHKKKHHCSYLARSKRRRLWRILTRSQMFPINKKEEPLVGCGNIKSKKTLEDCNKISYVPNERRRRKFRRRKVNQFVLRGQKLETEKGQIERAMTDQLE